MAKDYEVPKIEKTTPAVKTATNEDSPVVINNVKTDTVVSDLTSIYKKRIDNFESFIAGKYGCSDAATRDKTQSEFMSIFSDILSAKVNVTNACFDYLVKTIVEHPNTFRYENLFSSFYAMDKRPNLEISNKYIATLEFFVSLSKNITRRAQFLKGYDTTKLMGMYDQEQHRNFHIWLFE